MFENLSRALARNRNDSITVRRKCPDCESTFDTLASDVTINANDEIFSVKSICTECGVESSKVIDHRVHHLLEYFGAQ